MLNCKTLFLITDTSRNEWTKLSSCSYLRNKAAEDAVAVRPTMTTNGALYTPVMVFFNIFFICLIVANMKLISEIFLHKILYQHLSFHFVFLYN